MAAETVTEAPPTAPPAPAAPPKPRAPKKDAPTPAAKAKASKKQKGEKSSKSAEAESSADGPSVAAHPRAARGVALAKSWGGLAGFVLGGYLSLPTNTIAAAGLRALLAGIVCYLVAWAGAVFVWRRVVILEIEGREQQLLALAQPPAARREPQAAPGERPSAKVGSKVGS